MRFELRLILIFSITETHSPMQIKHIIQVSNGQGDFELAREADYRSSFAHAAQQCHIASSRLLVGASYVDDGSCQVCAN